MKSNQTKKKKIGIKKIALTNVKPCKYSIAIDQKEKNKQDKFKLHSRNIDLEQARHRVFINGYTQQHIHTYIQTNNTIIGAF